MTQGFIKFFERIEDPETDFLKKSSLNDSDMGFPRSSVSSFVRPGRQDRKAHVIDKVTVGRIDLGIVQISPVDSALQIIHHHVGSHPTKKGEHALLQPDEGGKLLI